MTSWEGFVWPESGHVEAPDWNPAPECGGGLHGFLWGEGDGSLANWCPEAKWLVVAVDPESVVNLNGKVKFPRGEVVFRGDRLGATNHILANGAAGKAVIGSTATAGDGGTATAGYRGTATAGDYGTATAGDRGTATAGDYGTATAGDGGIATAGDCGIATAGDGGIATAGDGGIINIRYWDSATNRWRIATAYVGENGILPGVEYRYQDGQFVPVDQNGELN